MPLSYQQKVRVGSEVETRISAAEFWLKRTSQYSRDFSAAFRKWTILTSGLWPLLQVHKCLCNWRNSLSLVCTEHQLPHQQEKCMEPLQLSLGKGCSAFSANVVIPELVLQHATHIIWVLWDYEYISVLKGLSQVKEFVWFSCRSGIHIQGVLRVQSHQQQKAQWMICCATVMSVT